MPVCGIGASATTVHRWTVKRSISCCPSFSTSPEVSAPSCMVASSHVLDMEGRGREAVREAALIAAHKPTMTQESKDLQVARRRWLETPAAVSQRAASLMAFHGLASPMARTLLVHDYGSFLAGVSASPAASVAAMGRIVRYENDYRALVRTSHGLQFVDSTVPLRVANDSNAKRPVDLRLVAAKGAFVPLNPLNKVSIADSSGGGVAVGTSGLRVTMDGQDTLGNITGRKECIFR